MAISYASGRWRTWSVRLPGSLSPMPSDMRMIGHLLYDSKMIFEDLLASWESGSWKVGIQGENIDFALLVN